MKNLSNLNNVKALSKKEQQSVFGGWDSGFCARFCPTADKDDWRYEACGCGDPPRIK
jgi:hypothetical protein